MLHPELPSPHAEPALEAALAAVDHQLARLGQALRERDGAGIEHHAGELHRALAAAVQRFADAARRGGVSPELRRRLAATSGQVAAQRESLARATAALDRAIDVLMPGAAAAPLYGAGGASARATVGGTAQA
jgi:hypothetical protein